MAIKQDLAAAVGNTPLIRLRKASELTGCEILGKAEFLNPGQSVKDRAALGMIRQAESDLKKAQDKQNEESRRYGIACAGGSSHIPGINGLSAPVFNHTGQMVAAITALGSAGVFNADPKSKEAALVKAAAAKLSNLLGYNEAAGDSA